MTVCGFWGRAFAAVVLMAVPLAAMAEGEPPQTDTKAAGAPDASGDNPFGMYLHTSLYSKYVFRGLTLYDGTSLQPSLGGYFDLGDLGRIGGGLWMHVPIDSGETSTLDLTGVAPDITPLFEPKVKFFELDPTVSYDVTFDMITLSAGHTWYTDPDKGELDVLVPVRDLNGNVVDVQNFTLQTSRGDTSEFYIGLSVDTVLQPEFTFVHDYRRFEYEYYTLGFSQPFTVSDEHNWTVTPYVRFAWSTGNEANLDSDEPSSGFYTKNGLVNVDVGLTTEVQMDNFTIKPSFNYVFVNDDAFGQDDIVWIGVDFDFSV